jgi:hypothetical protein
MGERRCANRLHDTGGCPQRLLPLLWPKRRKSSIRTVSDDQGGHLRAQWAAASARRSDGFRRTYSEEQRAEFQGTGWPCSSRERCRLNLHPSDNPPAGALAVSAGFVNRGHDTRGCLPPGRLEAVRLRFRIPAHRPCSRGMMPATSHGAPGGTGVLGTRLAPTPG